jgi:hypothetical protein
MHVKWILENMTLLAFLVLVELRYRFFATMGLLYDKTQILFYLLLISFLMRFLLYRVIKQDFNSLHAFLHTFTRIFLIVLCYTVTAKLDKDTSVRLTPAMPSQSKWLSAFWPFWIYIAVYLILTVIALGTWLLSMISYCNVILYPEEVNMQVISN